MNQGRLMNRWSRPSKAKPETLKMAKSTLRNRSKNLKSCTLKRSEILNANTSSQEPSLNSKSNNWMRKIMSLSWNTNSLNLSMIRRLSKCVRLSRVLNSKDNVQLTCQRPLICKNWNSWKRLRIATNSKFWLWNKNWKRRNKDQVVSLERSSLRARNHSNNSETSMKSKKKD